MTGTGTAGQLAPGQHHLPAEVASFVGRERELAEAKETLLRARLLTLTGVGGCGKTQLALRVAADLVPRFADSVWLIELAPVTDASLVPRAVAAVLGVSGRSDQPVLDTLVTALASKKLLLVVDNCEHLIAACAQIAETLLRGCPHLRMLATSREPLRVSGEVVRRVPSLALPAPGSIPTPESLAQVEAVLLFLERARAQQPDFSLTPGTAPLVAEICARLEGLPLAIELAVARLGALSLQEIAHQLNDSLRLLSRGRRTLPRQETLRATLDWSHALLSGAERVLFGRLSVFAGDFGVQAAELICGDDEINTSAVPTVLSTLVDKSLVEARVHGPEARYRLLEPVRQYAWDHLVARRESAALQRRHAEYYAELAEAAEPELMSPHRTGAIERLVANEDNLRAALNWARRSGETADTELGLRLASPMCWFWNFRGQGSEGLDWFHALLAKDTRSVKPRVRADALHAAGELAMLLGQNGLARAQLDESAALYRQLGEKRGLGYVLQALAMFIDPPEALSAAAESLRLFQDVGDAWGVENAIFSQLMARVAVGTFDEPLEEVMIPFRAVGDEWGIAEVLNFLGDFARSHDRDAQASELYEEALALLRKIGMRGSIPSLLHNLGYLALRAGDSRRALQLLRESLVLFRDQGDPRGIADCLEALAGVFGALKRPEQAARLFGAADVLREVTGAQVWPANAADVARNVAAVRDQLDPSTFSAARTIGRSLKLEQVLSVLEAAAEPQPTPKADRASQWNPLSARELEVAALVARGLTNKQIASELVISERTAATHVAHILDKLDLRTRAEIAAWEARAGLVGETEASATGHFGSGKPSVILRIAGTNREISQSDDVATRSADLP
ncbi:MAG: LuxR C-terminal-related transcriptional regulator [Chloroflexota bacterium]|nr:LuxR C-terminal-related transcriptional regulator [Chloroflexota bacterium]